MDKEGALFQAIPEGQWVLAAKKDGKIIQAFTGMLPCAMATKEQCFSVLDHMVKTFKEKV